MNGAPAKSPSLFSQLRRVIGERIAGPREGRATVGDPVSPASEDAHRVFEQARGGGVSPWVDERSALSLSAYFACVRAIADDTSKCDVVITERGKDGKRTVLEDHPAEDLLNHAPNPEMTAKVCRETLLSHAVGWGNGYAEIQPRGNGEPAALWPLLPDRMRPRRMPGGEIKYFYRGSAVGIPADRILHIPGLGFDGRVGYSVARIARDSLGSMMAAEKYGQSFFENHARPSLAFSSPGALSDGAYTRLKDSIENEYTGVLNTGKPMLLEEGMKPESMGLPPEEAQFLETRNHGVDEVARWFRMPVHKLARMDRATYSNIEQASIEYVVDCLLGWFIRAEQEYKRKLLGRPNLYAKHNVQALLRGDVKTRYDAYAVGRQWGWFCVNDICRFEDWNPIGPTGDVYLTPVNMANANTLTQPPAPAKPNEPTPGAPATSATDVGNAAAAARVLARAFGRAPNAMPGPIVAALRPSWAREFDDLHAVESDKAKRWMVRDEFATGRTAFLIAHVHHVRARIAPHAIAAAEAVIAAACLPEKAAEARQIGHRVAAAVADKYVADLASRNAGDWITRPEAVGTAALCDSLASMLVDSLCPALED